MPHYLIATMLTFGLTVRDRARTALTRGDDEGASTIEIVFWSVGLLALAGPIDLLLVGLFGQVLDLCFYPVTVTYCRIPPSVDKCQDWYRCQTR